MMKKILLASAASCTFLGAGATLAAPIDLASRGYDLGELVVSSLVDVQHVPGSYFQATTDFEQPQLLIVDSTAPADASSYALFVSDLVSGALLTGASFAFGIGEAATAWLFQVGSAEGAYSGLQGRQLYGLLQATFDPERSASASSLSFDVYAVREVPIPGTGALLALGLAAVVGVPSLRRAPRRS